MYAFGSIAADIGAGPLWVSESRNRSSENKIAREKIWAASGWARHGR